MDQEQIRGEHAFLLNPEVKEEYLNLNFDEGGIINQPVDIMKHDLLSVKNEYNTNNDIEFENCQENQRQEDQQIDQSIIDFFSNDKQNNFIGEEIISFQKNEEFNFYPAINETDRNIKFLNEYEDPNNGNGSQKYRKNSYNLISNYSIAKKSIQGNNTYKANQDMDQNKYNQNQCVSKNDIKLEVKNEEDIENEDDTIYTQEDEDESSFQNEFYSNNQSNVSYEQQQQNVKYEPSFTIQQQQKFNNNNVIKLQYQQQCSQFQEKIEYESQLDTLSSNNISDTKNKNTTVLRYGQSKSNNMNDKPKSCLRQLYKQDSSTCTSSLPEQNKEAKGRNLQNQAMRMINKKIKKTGYLKKNTLGLGQQDGAIDEEELKRKKIEEQEMKSILSWVQKEYNISEKINQNKLFNILGENYWDKFEIPIEDLYEQIPKNSDFSTMNSFLEYIITNSKGGNFRFTAQTYTFSTADIRREKVQRYLEKRRNQKFFKSTTSDIKKKVTDDRLRYKGRFVTKLQAKEILKIKHIELVPYYEIQNQLNIKTMQSKVTNNDVKRTDSNQQQKKSDKIKIENSNIEIIKQEESSITVSELDSTKSNSLFQIKQESIQDISENQIKTINNKRKSQY